MTGFYWTHAGILNLPNTLLESLTSLLRVKNRSDNCLLLQIFV